MAAMKMSRDNVIEVILVLCVCTIMVAFVVTLAIDEFTR